MVGGGAIHFLDMALPADDVQHPAAMRRVHTIPTVDSQFDVCFNEHNPAQILTACGDKTLKVWSETQVNAPIAVLKGHEAEV